MFLNHPRRGSWRARSIVCAALVAAALPASALAAPRSTARPAETRQAKAEAEKARAEAARRSAEDDKPAAKHKGGKLFAVVMGPGPSWKKGQPLRKGSNEGHWRYWQALDREGKIESAGPVGKDTGFVLLHARNQNEANAVLAADPAIRTGQYRGVARPYDETMGD